MSKKKIEPITGLSRYTDKPYAKSCAALFGLWCSGLSPEEYKLLDMFAAHIERGTSKKRTAVLTGLEVGSCLDTTLTLTELQARLQRLMSRCVINIAERSVALFEEATAMRDSSGELSVKLECTAKAMKYFFGVESPERLRYKLRSIMKLHSRYSYILFNYIESKRQSESWVIDLKALRELFDCGKETCYADFGVFNDRLLRRAWKEVNDNTECRFNYEPVKDGRTAVAVRFTCTPIESVPEASEAVQTAEKPINEKSAVDTLEPFAEAVNNSFTREQIGELYAILRKKALSDCTDNARLMLLRNLYAKLVGIERSLKIRDRYKYFRQMLKNA